MALVAETSLAQEVPPIIAAVTGSSAHVYDGSIPKPADVIGHNVGARHTEPYQVVDYFKAVAAASDRVEVREHARSYEGRPLVHAIVTSPLNHASLEHIRTENLRLSEDPGRVDQTEIEAMPAIVLMSYSVHGNEASGTEAALLLLYHLAAGEGRDVDRILDSAVVVIEPMLNPDGRGRFTTWVNRNRGRAAVSDPQDREHNEPWPGGRTNHYWFDLNRDYIPARHPETRGRLALFHHWRPQVVTDFHEMGSENTYFFQPGIPSRTNPNTPDLNQELTAEFGRHHAKALDGLPALYYSEETFDDFYYGKWSTYPDVNGAIGILFEQASSRALVRDTRSGELDYSYSVRNQFATSLSTLDAAITNRRRLLTYQRDFYSEADRVERPSGGRLVTAGTDRARLSDFAELMRRHRIQVLGLAQPVAAGGRTYSPGHSLFIPFRQPQWRLLEALFETRTDFPDSIFYDVSAWTLPLAYDLSVDETRISVTDAVFEPWTPADSAAPVVLPDRDAVAYGLRWDHFYAARTLNALQRSGAETRVATRAFRAPTTRGEQDFAPGTVVVTRGRLTADSLYALVSHLAAQGGSPFETFTSGLTPMGPDLGSPGNKLLTQRRIALLTGEGVSSYNAGEAWYVLSEIFNVPVSLLDVAEVHSADLSRYSTILMTGGRYGSLPSETIEDWVAAGGHLVATADASLWTVAHGLLDADTLAVNVDSLLTGVPFADRSNVAGAQYIGGSILDTRVDGTHPMAFGLGPRLPVFRDGRQFVSRPRGSAVVVATYAEMPLLSGYLPRQIRPLIRHAASVVTRKHGRGQVVVFAENPAFRGFWIGSSRMLLNAIFFAESL
jgi:hypothetical protein